MDLEPGTMYSVRAGTYWKSILFKQWRNLIHFQNDCHQKNPSNFSHRHLENHINKYVEQLKSKYNSDLISLDYKEVTPIPEQPEEEDESRPEEPIGEEIDEGEDEDIDENSELEKAMAESMKTVSVQSSD